VVPLVIRLTRCHPCFHVCVAEGERQLVHVLSLQSVDVAAADRLRQVLVELLVGVPLLMMFADAQSTAPTHMHTSHNSAPTPLSCTQGDICRGYGGHVLVVCALSNGDISNDPDGPLTQFSRSRHF